jgi:hypothetical protein
MPKKRFSRPEVLRLLERAKAYPAVFMPVPEGGFEVIFSNFADLRAYGVKRRTAEKAARELLTATILTMLGEGMEPPNPSDPDRLFADEDDPVGTEIVMVEADMDILRGRLGLVKPERSQALKALGLFGR